MKSYDKNAVRSAAQGRWDEIFSSLAPELETAMDKAGHHVPCPVHGGEDGFRLFPNFREKGAGICNSCGARSNGFEMLMWIHGWNFTTAVNAVGEFLNMLPVQKGSQSKVESFQGEILALGNRPSRKGGEFFAIELKFEQGGKKLFWGCDLKRALTAINAKVGDRVRITCLGKEPFTMQGKVVEKWLWSAVRLASKEDEQKKQREDEAKAREQFEAVKRLWMRSVPYQEGDTRCRILSRYFVNRGIDTSIFPPNDVRFCPDAVYRDKSGVISRHPAMIAVVRDLVGRPITLHKTFLSENGRKADVEIQKRLMPVPKGRTISGGAIRLGLPQGEILCVAEGIETALSVQSATGLPCWSTICAQGMKTLEIPESVKTVLVFADKDASGVGEEAAKELCNRLRSKGLLAIVMNIAEPIPEGQKGIDWNDILLSKGKDAFPVKAPL